jgi:hypothetical protein
MNRYIMSCPCQLADGTGRCNDDLEVEATYHKGSRQTHWEPAEPDYLELVGIKGPCRSGHVVDEDSDDFLTLRALLDLERPWVA